MFSIFSTQNLQTFLRRKNLRPPSRGGPPGPERLPNRGPERGPSWRGPSDRGLSLGADASTAGAFVSSVILAPSFLAGVHLSGAATSRMEYFRHRLPGYTAQAVAGVSLAAGAASTAGAVLTFLRDSRSCLILSRRFCSSSILTVRNLMTGSVTRKRRSSSCTTAPPPSTVSRR